MIDTHPIHDTVQVTKVVVDTIRGSSKDSIELLTKLDSFYNNSWSRLITIVTISFAVIGLLVPLLIQVYQQKKLKLSGKKLRQENNEEIRAAVASLLETFSKKIEQTQKEIKEYADKQILLTSDKIVAESYHLHAINSIEGGNHLFVVMYALDSIESYLKAGDYTHCNSLIELVKNHLPECKKIDVDNMYDTTGGFQKAILTLKLSDTKLERKLGVDLDEIQNLYDALT